MQRQTRVIQSSPAQVWGILADGWLYPLWMVGATAARSLEGGWPASGATMRHQTGFWPFAFNERTEVIESREESRLSLRIIGPLLGEVHLTLDLTATGSATEVTLDRTLVSGPRRVIPTPLRMRILEPWGRETLSRLAFVAENRRVEGSGA